MKEVFQALNIEKCIALGKKGMASLIICSMLMIDVAKAMDSDEDDLHSLTVVQRAPSPKPPPTDLRSVGSPSPEQTSSDGDSSPRSVSPPSNLQALDIIDSKPNSDDSGSSPEKSTLEGDKSLPVIRFPGLSPRSRQDSFALLPSSSPRQLVESQPEYFGTTPVTGSLQERIPLPSQTLSGASRTSSSYQDAGPSEKDPLLSSGTSSYGSSHSSSHSSESSSDSEEEVEISGPAHPQSKTGETAFGRFMRKFTSTQPSTTGQPATSHSSRCQSTPNAIDLRDNEILENSGNFPLLNPDDTSIQSQGPGYGELRVDVDLDGDENPASQSRFLPGWVSSWFSDHPFWPEQPTYSLRESALQRASQFLDPLRSRQAAETHGYGSDEGEERSTSSSDSSPQNSPTTSPRYVAPLPDSSESDGESVAHLLPTGQSHDAVRSYSSFMGIFPAAQGAFPFPYVFHSTGATASHPQPLQSTWLQILEGTKELSPTIKTQLIDFTHQILNGKSTWAQRLGKWLIGPLIGVGFAYGMAPVYSGGLTYLGNLNEAFDEFLKGNASNYLIMYIMYSALPDGISRNAHLWKKGIAYLSQEKKELGGVCIATAIAAVTALIPFAYLVLAENIARERFQLPNWDNGFGRVVIVRGIPLCLDDFVKIVDITMKSIPKLEDWVKQARQVFFPSSLPSQLKSFEAIQREKFEHDLTKLKHFLVRASNTAIEAIYKDVQDVIAGARSEVDLGAQQAFAAVSYLLSLGDEVQEVAKKNAKKSIAEIAFDGLKYTCLILGAPTTALLLQLVGSTVASLFTSNVVADSIGEGFSLVAFLPFNYVLAQSMDNFKNLVFSKDPRGHESHPAIRLPVKIFIGIQSFVYLFQTSVAVLQSYQKWFGDQWWPFAAGIPFFIPKLMGLTCSFNETFNELVTTSAINGYHKIGSKCKGKSLCTPCQKDYLIRFVESSRSNLERWDPELIHNLTKGIEIFKDEESDISFDEI